MTRRQTVPSRWLILDWASHLDLRKALDQLPRGAGVLLINADNRTLLRQVRRLAGCRKITVVAERRGAAMRVHDMTELRRALLKRTQLVFLSPIHPTGTHPDWRPIPRMRAGAMARLARRNILALGGMDERRFERVRPLGFVGWAGISAWERRNNQNLKAVPM